MATNTLRQPKNAPQKSVQSKSEPGSSQAKPALLTAAGTGVILTSVIWLVALISYVFTWQEDQSMFFEGSWSALWSSGEKAANWLGRLGAFLGHWSVYRGWGLGIVFIWFWFLLLGLKCLFTDFKVNLLDWGAKALWHASLTSVTLAFFFHACWEWAFPWGGAIGRFVVHWARDFAGLLGTGLALAGTWFAYVLILRGLRLTWPQKDGAIVPAAGSSGAIVPAGWSGAIVPAGSSGSVDPADPFLPSVPADPSGPSVPADPSASSDPADPSASFDPADPSVSVVPADPFGPSVPKPPASFTQDPPSAGPADPAGPDQNSRTEDGFRSVHIGGMEVALPQEEEVLADAHTVALTDTELYDPKLDLSSYRYPTLDLLAEHGASRVQVNPAELEANKDQIVFTLRQYGIEIDKIKATVGPTVTLYEIIPAAGVRISRIKNLEDDIALSLAALGIRIIAPMPGKGTVGIEVPNQNKELVAMRSLLASDRFVGAEMELPVALGKTISNEIYVADLTKMPHLLMAGATGQGKSVGINALLVSLLYKKHPSELKLVLVDPKKVELSLFRKIEKHFLACLPDSEDAIVTDTRQVVHTVNALGIEMDRRYDLLKDAQVRNLVEYNNKFRKRSLSPSAGHRYLPYIVVVIDEFADLIMTAGKEIEFPITRLAQLARAVGIHLIVATQRPSVNIITGTIKANFPARIAYKVSSKIDSRTILDAGGAEQLIGRGDMLLSLHSGLVRLQCAFVDTPEVEAVCDFIGNQQGYATPMMLPEYKDPEGDKDLAGDGDAGSRDALFDEAARMVVQYQQGSTSLLQRKMNIGYARAGRLIDQLESAGIVGRFEGSKPREVLYTDLQSLEERLRQNR